MRLLLLPKAYWIVLVIVIAVVTFSFVTSGHKVDYNTEVKPIFNK